MISFERPGAIEERLEFVKSVASGLMREKARYYDEHEHEIPWEFVNLMWERQLKTGESFRSADEPYAPEPATPSASRTIAACTM